MNATETVAAREMRVWLRGRALCAAAEPHNRWKRPCTVHLAEARRQLGPAVASSSATGGPAFLGAGDDGAAGRDRRLAAAPPSDETPRVVDLMAALEASLAAVRQHRAVVRSDGPAERASDLAQNEGTRCSTTSSPTTAAASGSWSK